MPFGANYIDIFYLCIYLLWYESCGENMNLLRNKLYRHYVKGSLNIDE